MAPAVQTAPARTRPLIHLRALNLWHLLSLDAPTVAALWTWTAARAAHVELPIAAPAAMFVAVWMLYAADRLLDSLNPAAELEARHLFHHRHRTAFLAGIAAGAVILIALAHYSNPEAVRLYALLGALLAAWFILIHASRGPHRLPKELAVGLFFAAAIFIPSVARRPDLRLHLIPHAILAAITCALNCLFIYAWEHPHNRDRAHLTTRAATNHLPLLTAITLAAAIAIAALTRNTGPWQLDAACALSCIAYLILHRTRARIAPITLRAAADVALLTPLLVLPFLQ